jgi:hypothetical protein
MKKTRKYAWAKSSPVPVKLTDIKKILLKSEVRSFIENSPKLSKSINRFEVKAGRIYFYELVEQHGWDDPNSRFIVPLIDGKYLECKYARITIYAQLCTLDWQRHNDQWMAIFSGSLNECLQHMNERDEWFA